MTVLVPRIVTEIAFQSPSGMRAFGRRSVRPEAQISAHLCAGSNVPLHTWGQCVLGANHARENFEGFHRDRESIS